jgi:hypothetical protein
MNDWPFFHCPKCKVLYHVVEVAPARKIVGPRRSIVEAGGPCRLCGEPLPRSKGLRYFLLPTTASRKAKRR